MGIDLRRHRVLSRVRLDRWLALAGKVEGAIALAIIVPTLLFVAARSALGFACRRVQRELWRRDVDRFERG